jgi:hypothetical protein
LVTALSGMVGRFLPGRSDDDRSLPVAPDSNCTVDLEHMTRHAGDHPQPRTQRCTQVYRRADGVWKGVLRKPGVTWRPDNTWAQSRSCMTGDRTNHVQTFRLRY